VSNARAVAFNGTIYPSRVAACKALGINYNTFNSQLNNGRTVTDLLTNPPKPLKTKVWDVDEINIIRKYASTKTADEIGIILGRSRASVAKKAFKMEISMKKKNEHHHFTTYSNLHVAMVHCLLDGGYTPTEVSAFSDRSRDSIKKIKYELTRTLP
jgi:hypothetical protein